MPRIRSKDIYINATRLVTFDLYEKMAANLGTTVESVAWSIEEGSTITIDQDSIALANSITTATVTSSSESGCNLVRVDATMANGEVLPAYGFINVIDPSCEDC